MILTAQEVSTQRAVACLASVPIRSERNSGRAKEFFTFGPHEKWGEGKVEGGTIFRAART